MDTLSRQWAMLKLIPRYPRRTSAGEIHHALETQGYTITLRTIQRDLNNLSSSFPLSSDQSKPQGWWWGKETPLLEIPGLDPQSSLVFKMAEIHLSQVLPATTLAILNPWFKAANGVMENQENGLGRWVDKIRILPRGLPLLPPKIDAQIQEAVYQGLLENKRIAISYRGHNAQAVKNYEINPLGLVQKNQIIYIVCTVNEYNAPRLLLMHRIHSAQVCNDKSVQYPKDFNLDAYIANGELSYRVGPDIKLVADFETAAATILYETPLTEHQTLEKQVDGKVRLKATLPDTMDLRAWLRSFGKQIRIIEPENFLAQH